MTAEQWVCPACGSPELTVYYNERRCAPIDQALTGRPYPTLRPQNDLVESAFALTVECDACPAGMVEPVLTRGVMERSKNVELVLEYVVCELREDGQWWPVHRFHNGDVAVRTLINWQRERPEGQVHLSVQNVPPRTERVWVCPHCDSDDLRVTCLVEVEDDVDQDREDWPAPEGAFLSDEHDVTEEYRAYRYRCVNCEAQDIAPMRIERRVFLHGVPPASEPEED